MRAARLVLRVCIGILFVCAVSASAQLLDLLSVPRPEMAVSGANGDSLNPILSADGRFVLFASAGDNLVGTNGSSVPVFPQHLNVYLRDRTLGTTVLISANPAGLRANGDSIPSALSPDGRYALFESNSSDLVAGDTNKASDIFLRDVSAGTTSLVSANTNGVAGNNLSRSAVMTPDGRFVAFVSIATDLVPGDTNGISDVFIRDVTAGTTSWVTPGAVRTRIGGASEAPEISADGRFVAFYSTATNLAPAAGVNGEIYLRDLTQQTNIWVSAYGRSIIQSNSIASFNHALTPDGRFLAYQTGPLLIRYDTQLGTSGIVASNTAVSLTLRPDEIHNLDITPDGRFIAFVASTNSNTTFVQLWDSLTGLATLVSGDPSGGIQLGSTCDFPTVDPTGRYVAFQSTATNLTTNSLRGDYHLYLRDLQAGGITLLDADSDGVGAGVSANNAPILAADASVTVLECKDSNLVPGDINSAWDLFIRNLISGSVELLSARDAALPSATVFGFSGIGLSKVSSDGRFAVFSSEASNLVTNDHNGQSDVFLEDFTSGEIKLISAGTNGFSAEGHSEQGAMSADGRYVVFRSTARLVPEDTNNCSDVYLRDLESGTLTLASRSVANAAVTSGDSYEPMVSAGGRYVVFRSTSRELVGTPPATPEALYFRDMQQGTNFLLSNPTGTGPTIIPPVMTPDGRYVLFGNSSSSSPFGPLYLWDCVTGARIFTNSGSVSFFTMTPDGQRLVFLQNGAIYLHDLSSKTNRLLDSGIYHDLQISANGQWIVFAKLRTTGHHVFLLNPDGGAATMIDGDLFANGWSDSPDISPDGRYIAFRGCTSTLPNNFAPPTQIYLYDRFTGSRTLVSAGPSGAGNDLSGAPVFSGDGSRLFFGTWASDLIKQDLNHRTDLVVYTLLTLSIDTGTDFSTAPFVSWPWTPGRSYTVQFKDAVGDGAWLPISGIITNIAGRGVLHDVSAPNTHRFYRISAY